MSLCTISGKLVDASGTSISGASVNFNTQTPSLASEPAQASTTTATDGTWSVILQQSLSGIFTISAPVSNLGSAIPYQFNVNIPAAASAAFSSIVVDS